MGLVAGAIDTPWSWGYWPYSNPYYVAPTVFGDATYNYSQPIASAVPATNTGQAIQITDNSQGTASESPTDQATDLLNAARNVFEKGEYQGALSLCNTAISKTPNAVVLHEFRGLTQFALKDYKEAACTIYAVLSVGPGWDWTTLSSLYPNVDVYSSQLRALEQYVLANPNVAQARFLLAYHYMTCGHVDAAAQQFKAAAELNSKDQLSVQLANTLTKGATPDATPTTAKLAAPSAPAKPIEGATLVGDWKASRSDGTSIALRLNKDGKYTWKLTQQGKPIEYNGPYSVADGLLILKQNDAPVMVGQVTLLADNQFNFKLPGDNPSDPGLTFGK